MDGAFVGVLVPVDALDATEGEGDEARLLLIDAVVTICRFTESDIVKGGAVCFFSWAGLAVGVVLLDSGSASSFLALPASLPADSFFPSDTFLVVSLFVSFLGGSFLFLSDSSFCDAAVCGTGAATTPPPSPSPASSKSTSITSGSPDVIGFLDTYPSVPDAKNETHPVRFEFMESPIGFEFNKGGKVVRCGSGSVGAAAKAESVEAVSASAGNALDA
jgi:hypothetical protein